MTNATRGVLAWLHQRRARIVPLLLYPVFLAVVIWAFGELRGHGIALSIGNLWMALALLATLLIHYRALKDDRALLAAAAFFALLRWLFLCRQQPQGYTYDLQAHLNTIYFYCNNLHLGYQPFSHSNESHQPLLYYLLSGAVCRLTLLWGEHGMVKPALASLNYVFFSAFLLYGIAYMRRSLRSRFLLRLGVLALLAWPANLLHGYRIGNDALLYLAFMGGAYHFLRWQEGGEPRQMACALYWLAVGLATKNSILLMPIVWAALLPLTHAQGRNPLIWARQMQEPLRALPWRSLWLPLLLCALALAAGLGHNAYNAATTGNTTLLEGKHSAPMEFIFQPWALLEFHLPGFLSYPFTYSDMGKDDYFWNMYLRTLAFGEYRWADYGQAIVIDVLLAALWCYFFAMSAMAWLRRRAPAAFTTSFTYVLSMLCATAFMRMMFNGFVPWVDARHLYPVIVFFLTGYASLLEERKPSFSASYRIGTALLCAFFCVSTFHTALQVTDSTPLPIVKGATL